MSIPLFDENSGNGFHIKELSSKAATPDTSKWKVYFKSDGLYMLDDAGTETKLQGGAPDAHKDTHKSGGSDAFASGDLLEAVVKRIQTSTGPTDLLVGAIADGEFLKRSGSAIIGGTASGGASNASLFTFSHTSGAASTGALGFTPLFAVYLAVLTSTEAMSVGFATGTGTGARCIVTYWNSGGSDTRFNFDGDAIAQDKNGVDLDVTAWGSANITVTWASPVSAHTGYMLVVG